MRSLMAVTSAWQARITYTGGCGPLGSEAAYGPPTMIIMLASVDVSPRLTSIVTAPWTRNEHGALAGVKSASYAENVRGLGYAANHDASEAIFLNTAGHVCEGPGPTSLWCSGDTVITPPRLTSGPLAGVTRELIMEWSTVEQRDVTLDEAKRADEVFITSSMRDVQGVEHWDDQTFGPAHPVAEQLPPPSPSGRSRSRSVAADRVSIRGRHSLSASPESGSGDCHGQEAKQHPRAVRASTVDQQDRGGRGQAQYAGHDPQSRDAK